ncbi:MAG: sodium:proton antiporter [bacterium]|nr:sodium:proton antiporter [bacterium]
MHKTDILDVVSRKLSPFILLFGCYLIAYGHLSPGGGFQGGVVLASGIILLILGKDVETIQRFFPLKAVGFVEMCGLLGFLLVGLLGLIFSAHFLKDFLPLASADELPHAGFIFLLNTIIGLKVGAGMTLLCFYLLKDDEEEDR